MLYFGSFHLDNFTDMLRREGSNLIILKDGEAVFTSNKDGMQPLLQAIDCIGLPVLGDSIVVDKIVGKAAALLISYFKAREVHCIVLSVRAKEVLDKQGIKYYSETMIQEIRNKLGTDICPFEKSVLDVVEPEEGYKLLVAKMKLLQISGAR